MEKLRIIVGGYIGLYPTGGATWDYIQYPLGLKMLGHDVYYFEDTAQYPVYQEDGALWDDSTATIAYIKAAMENVGLQNNWAYRDVGTKKWHGMPESKIREIFETADVFINVSSATYIWPEYLKIPTRVLVDTDPMFTQVEFWEMMNRTPCERLDNFMSHTHFFTFGLNMGKPNCAIPDLGLQWHTTRKPICLEYWNDSNNSPSGKQLSSILNWIERSSFSFGGQSWGQKNIVFKRFERLPERFPSNRFELVINTGNKPEVLKEMQHLKENGWHILNPHQHIENMTKYNRFIRDSYVEFSISKETYIKSNSGWFSGRSACYLAAGKPVITQDTRWSEYIPAGTGVLTCYDEKTAGDAILQVNLDYPKHSRAAKEIAETYFSSDVVLNDLLSHLS